MNIYVWTKCTSTIYILMLRNSCITPKNAWMSNFKYQRDKYSEHLKSVHNFHKINDVRFKNFIPVNCILNITIIRLKGTSIWFHTWLNKP